MRITVNFILELLGIAVFASYMFGAMGLLPGPILQLVLTLVIPLWGAGFLGWMMWYDHKMKPVDPYYTSLGKNTLMLYTTKSGRAYFRDDAKYIAQVLEISNEKTEELMAFSKNDKGALKFGEGIMEIVYDGANMTLRPEYLLAVEALKKQGYRTIDELQVAVKAGRFKDFVDSDLGIEIKKHGDMDSNGVYIPLFKSVNVHEIIGFVLGSATIFKSFVDTRVTMERLKQQKTGMQDPNTQSMVLLIIVACVGLGILKATGVI